MTTNCDVLIIGGGIAGSCLAWALWERGVDFVLVDDRPAVSCSRIAAGLVTPITGPRLAVAWRWDEFWPAAQGFYARVADRANHPLLHARRMVRLFGSDDEVRLFHERRLIDAAHLVAPLDPPLAAPLLNPVLGGFEMPAAGQLDVPALLDATWSHFTATGATRVARIDPASFTLTTTGIGVPALDLVARRVLFAEGYPLTSNPWFPEFPFRPAQGDILTLRIPDLAETRVIHGPVWLAPVGNGLFRCGSTYEWTRLDRQPSAEARASIIQRLAGMLAPETAIEVVAHHAAIRPALRRFHPVIARSPRCGEILSLNGLGSKGSLQAPFLATHLADHLVDDSPLDRSLVWPIPT
jgi:glycine oxidase